MADYFWKGGSGSNGWSTAANWVTTSGGGTAHSTPPTASDDVYFDSNSGTDCVLDNTNLTAAYIYVESGFPYLLTTSGLTVKVVMDGLQVSQAAVFDFTASTEFELRSTASGWTSYVNSSSTTSNNHYIRYLIDSSPFADDTARFATTYDLNSKDYCLVDGVYGNIDRPGNLEAKAIFKDTSGGAFNSYGSVDLLAFTNTEFTSTSTNPDVYDYDKQFYFEGRFGSDSSLSYRIGENFKFGHTTVIFRAGTDSNGQHFQVPVKGDIISSGSPRGNITTNVFNVQYHKVIIRAPPLLSEPRYCYIEDGRTLECNELVIEAGGRLYGPAEGEQVASSKIKSVKRPTVQGDWNFKQIADGIYESIDNIPTLPVTEGGTGLNIVERAGILYGDGQNPLGVLSLGTATQVLVVNDDETGVEWGQPEHLQIQVRNDEGATIPVGAPLYSKGEIGGSERIKVGIADAGDANKMPCIGIANAEMNTTTTKDGLATVGGVYNTNLDSGFTGLNEGDIVYVKNWSGTPTAPSDVLTITKPTGPTELVQNVGIILKTNGTIIQGLLVSVIGRTNDVPNTISIEGDITSNGNISALDGIITGNTFVAGYAAGDAIFRTYNTGDHLELQTYDAGTSAFVTELEILNDQGGIQITNDVTSSGDLTLDRGSETSSLTRTLTIGGARNATDGVFAEIAFKNYDSDSGAADYTAGKIRMFNSPDGDDDGTMAFYTANNETLNTSPSLTITDTGYVRVGPSGSFDAPLTVSQNTTTTGPSGNAQLVVKGSSTTGQDASIEVRGARNASTTAVPTSIKFTNYDNDLTDTNTLGAVIGKVTNHTTNVGSLILQTSADGSASALSDRLTITSAGDVTIANDLTVQGDFTVSGTTTTVDTTNLNITDNIITLNDGETGAGVTLGTAGIEIDRGTATNATFVYEDSIDAWVADSKGTARSLKLVNQNGYIEFGPQNTSYAHITTDRDRFYFNRDLVIGENAIASYNGDFSIRRSQSTDEQIVIADNSMTFTSAGNDVVTVDGSNNRLGVGVSSPSDKLHVAGNILVGNNNSVKANGTGVLILGNTDGGQINVGGNSAISFIEATSNSLHLRTQRDQDDIIFSVNAGGTEGDDTVVEAMRIHGPDGYIGIGTTSPDTELHVEGRVLIDAYEQGAGAGLFFREGFLNTNQPSITVQDHSGANPDGLAISAYDGISFRLNAVEAARFTSAGDLALNTTSAFTVGQTAQLTVAGGISWGLDNTDLSYFRRLSAGNFQWQTYNSGNTGNIHLQPYGGNVGIGTTSPATELEVDGTITAEGLNLQNGRLEYGGGVQQAADLAVGWYTFAVLKGRDATSSAQRAFGEFLINDVDSGRHGSCRLNATHFFGSGNSIQVFAYNFYSVAVFDQLRIKKNSTYDGAALQVYVSNANNNLETYMTMSEQNQSWDLLTTWLADSDDAGHDAILGFGTGSWTNFSASETVDLSVFAVSQGGIYTTGGLSGEELDIYSSTGIAIQTENSAARHKRIFATTSNDGSPWDEAVYYSRGSTGGWSGQHTFTVDKNGSGSDTGYEALRIRDSGNGTSSEVLVSHVLGVGTTSPDTILHVSGVDPVLKITDTTGSDNRASIWLQESDSFGARLAYESSGNDFFNINIIDGGTETTRMAIDRYGKVGINNTTPTAHLDVTVVGSNTTTSGIAFGDSAGKGYLAAGSSYVSFATNDGTTRIAIDNGGTNVGNVGIGLTNPSTELEIVSSGTLTLGNAALESNQFRINNTGGYAAVELGGSSGAYIDMKSPFSDDYDVRILTDGSGMDFYTSTDGTSANGAIRMKIEDTKIQLQEDLHFATGAAPKINGGNQNPLIIYGNTDGSPTSTSGGYVTWSTASAVEIRANSSEQTVMRVKDNKEVDFFGLVNGPGRNEGAYGANSFHFGDTGSTEADDWYEVFRWSPNAVMSSASSAQFRNFAARFSCTGRGIQRINFDIYVRGEYGTQDSNGWWTREFIIDSLDEGTDDDGNASPDLDSLFLMVYNSGTSLSYPYASLYMRRDENWELRSCNLVSMFTNCAFEFLDNNVGETTPTNDGNTGSYDLSPSIRRKLFVDSNNQLINGVGATGIYFDDTNDRIGIGISSPNEALHIRAASDHPLVIENTTNAGYAGIQFSDNSDASYGQKGELRFNHADSSSEGSGASFHFTTTESDLSIVGGKFIASDSSASEPGFAFAGDVNSGLFQINSDDIALVTVGTERLTVANDGNVGIGETSPTFPLHVKYTDNRTDPEGSGASSGAGAIGADAEGGGLYIENASTTDGAWSGITFRTDTADARIAYQSVGSSLINEGQMSFFLDADDTGGNQLILEEVLRLRGGGSGAAQTFNSAYVNGRLGVGVVTPTDTLAVSGGIKIGEFNSTDGTDYAGTSPPSDHNNNTGAADPQIRVAGRTSDQPGIIQMAYFDANNFFGGTGVFTLGRLQYAMNENSNTVTTVAEIRGITSKPNDPGHFDGALQFWTSQGDTSGANLTEKMVLTADGYLGIGTDSPDRLLEIQENGTGAAYLRLSNTNTSYPNDTVFGSIEFYNADASGPGVGATIDALSNGSGRGGYLQFKTDADGSGSPTTRMTIDENGLVGIGVTAPVSTLDIGASGALSLGNIRTQLKITNTTDLQLGHADNAHILIDTFNTSTDNYFSVRKNSTTASSATELFRVNENGKIKFNDAYDFPNAAGSTGDILTLQGNEVTFTTQDRITRPAVFMDTGTQNITLVETTVGFNSEILDGGSNAALSGVNDGHIQLTAGGYYRISYSIPINDDGSSGADRTRVFCFMQTSNDDSFTSPTVVAQSYSQVYTREASGGSGLSTSFIYEHTGEDYIRLRIDAQQNTDISTESNQAQISIDYLGPA